MAPMTGRKDLLHIRRVQISDVPYLSQCNMFYQLIVAIGLNRVVVFLRLLHNI